MDMTSFNICALISVPFFVTAAVFFVKDIRSSRVAEGHGSGGTIVEPPDYFPHIFLFFGSGLTIVLFGLGLSIVSAMK